MLSSFPLYCWLANRCYQIKKKIIDLIKINGLKINIEIINLVKNEKLKIIKVGKVFNYSFLLRNDIKQFLWSQKIKNIIEINIIFSKPLNYQKHQEVFNKLPNQYQKN